MAVMEVCIKRSSLERLPVEIQQRVMGCVGIEDLYSIALSCRVLYSALRDGLDSISLSIASHTIGPDILPLAIARQAASIVDWKPGPHGDMLGTSADLSAEIIRFGRAYLMDSPRILSLDAARQLLSFHDKVTTVAIEYARFCLLMRPDWNKVSPWPQHPPTSEELSRFARALYIMDIARQIVPIEVKRAEGYDHSPSTLLWLHFSLWEHRQVEFLMNLLHPYCQHKYSPRYGIYDPLRFEEQPNVLEGYGKWQMLRGVDGLYAVVKSRHLRYGFFFHELSRFPDVYNPGTYPTLRPDFRLEDGDVTWVSHPSAVDGVRSLEVEDLRAVADFNPMSVWLWEVTCRHLFIDDFLGFASSVAPEEWSAMFWDDRRLGLEEWSLARVVEL